MQKSDAIVMVRNPDLQIIGAKTPAISAKRPRRQAAARKRCRLADIIKVVGVGRFSDLNRLLAMGTLGCEPSG